VSLLRRRSLVYPLSPYISAGSTAWRAGLLIAEGETADDGK
jgi:hypothetical protein